MRFLSVPSLRPLCGCTLFYAKDWMAELDNQDSMQYRSKWLAARSNRGNLARFFKLLG